MIREDRELLAELARLNSEMASLAMRLMDGSADAAEQRHYAQRLIASGQRLQRRVDVMQGAIVEGQVVGDASTARPTHTVELDRDP